MNALGKCTFVFLLCWKTLERKTDTTPHAINISFIMAVSKIFSVDKMKEFVIVKDLSHSDVSNMLQEKNPDVKGISEISVKRFCTSNNIRKRSNLSKEEFQKITFMEAFMEIIVFRKVLKRIKEVIQLLGLHYYHYKNIH